MPNDGPAMHLTRSYTQPPGHPVGHSPNSAFSPAARRRQLPDYEYIKNNSRFQKPSQAIYRPPLARRADESDESPSSHSSESFLPIKSALKRSKSFGNPKEHQDELMYMLSSFDGDIASDHVMLMRKALDNPNMLMMTQLMEVVRVVCNKAMERPTNGHVIAKICLKIIDKESGHLFVESLLNCLREWFNERDKLRMAIGGNRRWTAYIAFLTELYMSLRSKHRRVKLLVDESINSKERSDQAASLHSKQYRTLAMLLYDSCQVILLTPTSTTAELECLQSVLRTVGPLLDDDYPQRMHSLMMLVRDAFLNPAVSSLHQKSLMEIIEFYSSKWHFNQSQQLYYFPYTKGEID